jgi:hypothetical protein
MDAIRLRSVRAPQDHAELLTLREACRRFDIDRRQIWVWAALGQLHPVRPAGRTLYPEWELEALISTATYLRRLEPAASAA